MSAYCVSSNSVMGFKSDEAVRETKWKVDEELSQRNPIFSQPFSFYPGCIFIANSALYSLFVLYVVLSVAKTKTATLRFCSPAWPVSSGLACKTRGAFKNFIEFVVVGATFYQQLSPPSAFKPFGSLFSCFEPANLQLPSNRANTHRSPEIGTRDKPLSFASFSPFAPVASCRFCQASCPVLLGEIIPSGGKGKICFSWS